MNMFTTAVQKQTITALMGVVLCFGIVFGGMPQKAQAATEAELQAEVARLAALIAELQATSNVATYQDISLGVFPEEKVAYIGSENHALLNVEVYAASSTYTMTDMEIAFGNNTGDVGTDPYPWNSFTEISLWMNGDKIYTFDATHESDWRMDVDTYAFKLEGLDIEVLEESNLTNLLVAVSVDDTAPAHNNWRVGVSDATFVSDSGGSGYTFGNPARHSFDVVDGDGPARVVVSESSDNPDATSIQVDDENNTDYTNVLAFNLEEENGVDVSIDTLTFDIDYSGTEADIGDVFWEAALYYEGQLLAETDVVDELVTFEGVDIELAAYDEQAFELDLSFEAAENYDNGGDFVFFDISFESIDEMEDGNGNFNEEITVAGTASSEEFILMTGGVEVELLDTATLVTEIEPGEEMGAFQIDFEVTSFDNDVTISPEAIMLGEAGKDGYVQFGINADAIEFDSEEYEEGMAFFSHINALLHSNAALDTRGHYLVEEGDTEEFTLLVDFNPVYGGFYSVYIIDPLPYSSTDGSVSHIPLDELEFATDSVHVSSLAEEPVDENTCESDGTLYPEGTETDSIVVDGETQVIADAYFVCRAGEWEVEGSLPVPVEDYTLRDVKRITAQKFVVTKENVYTIYRIVMKDTPAQSGVVHRVKRPATMNAADFTEAVRGTGYTGDMKYFNKKVKKLVQVKGTPYYMKQVESITTTKSGKNTIYNIRRTDGTGDAVKKTSRMTAKKFEQKVRATGFAGAMKNFNAAAVSGSIGRAPSLPLADPTQSGDDCVGFLGNNDCEEAGPTEEELQESIDELMEQTVDDAAEETGSLCYDGVDNDYDGLVDATDSDCAIPEDSDEEESEHPGPGLSPEDPAVSGDGCVGFLGNANCETQAGVEEEEGDAGYRMKDVKQVTAKKDGSKTIYTIKLKDGTKYTASRRAKMNDQQFLNKLRKTGYEGSLKNFEKVVKGQVKGVSISADPYVQLASALTALEAALEDLQAHFK